MFDPQPKPNRELQTRRRWARRRTPDGPAARDPAPRRAAPGPPSEFRAWSRWAQQPPAITAPPIPRRRATPARPAAPPPAPRRAARRGLRWLGAALLLVLFGATGYAGLVGASVLEVSNRIYHPLPPLPPDQAPANSARLGPDPATPPPAGTPPARITAYQLPPAPDLPGWALAPALPTAAPAAPVPPGRINILLLGTDKRAELGDDTARSDTIIIVSLDPQAKTAGILSVPRDLQVTLPHYGLQKINAAYFFGEYDKLPGGGPALAVPTISRFLQVPIPYYVAINFDGFQKVIDLVGGIDINVPAAIDDSAYPGPYNSVEHIQFAAGCQHMDGARALQYARTRHADSDFGRARRQQQVIKAVREKALALNMLPRYMDLLNQIGDAVETNIPPEQQWALARLAGDIGSQGLYTAQIDSTMVLPVGSTDNLELRWDKARPMLDAFFGRTSPGAMGQAGSPPPTLTAEKAGAGPLAPTPGHSSSAPPLLGAAGYDAPPTATPSDGSCR
ncbi:MAG TPA: LCP family protein [Chloroflexia bacterium]|nr:LCP family protein [Chloroflexia bacterium]